MDYKKVPKSSEIFYCNLCDYYTCRKSQYDRHILTYKHKKITQDDEMDYKKVPKSSETFSCNCGKEYKHRQGLWKHKKSCCENSVLAELDGSEDNKIKIYNEPTDKDLIMMLIKENSELKTIMLEQQNMMMKVIENGTTNNSHNTTTNNTNSHNKAFNLQFFLNETCKDAMNIMDFVESIQLQLSDLEKVGELGYVEGISNIIVKNLKEMDVTQRPVHCTDKKRETIYIKDENKWEKDDEKNKIRKMIKRVASKNQRLLLKFKELHPDCIKYHSKHSDQYNKLIVESMGGSGNNDLEKEDKIIRNIAKNVVVDKDS